MSKTTAMDTVWCERLYTRKAGEIILYGRALGLSHAEAEDVLQETFIALLKLKNEPDDAEHYVLRSFRNRAMNHHRSLWRRIKREFESSRWFEKSSTESDRELAAMKYLAKLPLEQKEVIVLKIWHRYTFEAIGQILDLSPNTVAGRYRYGIKKLKTCLNGETYERSTIGEPVEFLETTESVSGT